MLSVEAETEAPGFRVVLACARLPGMVMQLRYTRDDEDILTGGQVVRGALFRRNNEHRVIIIPA